MRYLSDHHPPALQHSCTPIPLPLEYCNFSHALPRSRKKLKTNRCLLVTYSPIQKCNYHINQVVTLLYSRTSVRSGFFVRRPFGGSCGSAAPSQKPDPRKRPASCPSRPLCNLLSITFPLLLPDSGFGRPSQIFPRSGYRTEIFDTFAGFLTRTHICSKESPPSFCSSYRTPS